MKPKRHSFAIPHHWKIAKVITHDFIQVIWQHVSYGALCAMEYGTTHDFYHDVTELDGTESCIFVRLYRLRELEDHNAATCSRNFNSVIDIYISDELIEKGFRAIKKWTRQALFHEVTHALQRRLLLMYKLPLAEQWDIGVNVLDGEDVHDTQRTYEFLHLTTWHEMDANLSEYWCMHGHVPRSRKEMYEGVYSQYDFDDSVLKKVARFVWNYWFAGKKEAMLQRRLDIYHGSIQLW